MELEDLGPPTFAKTVVRYRGQLLELKTSDNQTGFHNINCAKDMRGRKNPYYATSSSRLARRSSGCCRGQCQLLLQRALPAKLAWYMATQQELRAVVPLTQPRKSAEVRCSHALRLISCVCLTDHAHSHTHVAGGSTDAAGEDSPPGCLKVGHFLLKTKTLKTGSSLNVS